MNDTFAESMGTAGRLFEGQAGSEATRPVDRPEASSRLRELEAEMADLTEPGERGDWLPVESPRRRSMAGERMPGVRRMMPLETREARKAAEPTIRVTIGRIEVRPLDEKAKPAPEQRTVFSLEGYLRGRRRQGW